MINTKDTTVIILAIGLLIFGIYTWEDSEKRVGGDTRVVSADTYAVTRVIDGDTLETSIGTVRLLGVDAPELGECFYEEAKSELSLLALGELVRLESDPLNEDRDEYGRFLRYIYLEDGILVNGDLIEQGFAEYLSWFPIQKSDTFAELETEAREAGKGLWAACK